MAKWIYNRPYECCNEGELQVARTLARLDDSWIIRWGFYYDTDREGDFLILGPTGGLLVLEVKAGQLRNLGTTGRWEGADHDHPLAQLSAEWKAVIQRLGSFAQGHPSLFVAKALCLPDLTIDRTATEFRGIDRHLIIDRRDLSDFIGNWRHRLFERNLPVSAEGRKLFAESYAAEITPKVLKQFVSETDRILLRHLQGDYEILEMLGRNRQLLVEGGPGTGKTWLALDQAYRFAEGVEGGVRVLLLCYNLALAALLEELVAKRRPARGEVVVRSWEGLAKDLFSTAGLAWVEPETFTERYLYFTREVPALMQQIVEEPGFVPKFDALVVDEAQDLDTTDPLQTSANGVGWWACYFRLLRAGTAAPMGIFYDAEQRPIFRNPKAFIIGTLRAHLPQSAHLRLLHPRRYAQPVFEFIQSLRSPTTDRMIASLHSDRTLPEGPAVEVETVPDGAMPRKVTEVIVRWISEGLCRTDQILILAPQSLAKTSLAGCERIGEWALVDDYQHRPGQLNLLSVRRAKGLDALAVILIDFPSFSDLAEGQQKMDFFIGASRARQLLAVLHPLANH